jgi:hypothetical protein
MKRSSLPAGKTIACSLTLAFVFGCVDAYAQNKPNPGTGQNPGKTTKHTTHKASKGRKKKNHMRQVEIINHSDDDKKLEQIKAEKDKEKGLK